jgi:methionyl-tRNA synthetase
MAAVEGEHCPTLHRHRRARFEGTKDPIWVNSAESDSIQVQRASAKAGVEPKLFCDKGAAIFKELAQRAEVTYDHFVRTTDKEHKDAVEYAWV